VLRTESGAVLRARHVLLAGNVYLQVTGTEINPASE
jgi:hypothetical protein